MSSAKKRTHVLKQEKMEIGDEHEEENKKKTKFKEKKKESHTNIHTGDVKGFFSFLYLILYHFIRLTTTVKGTSHSTLCMRRRCTTPPTRSAVKRSRSVCSALCRSSEVRARCCGFFCCCLSRFRSAVNDSADADADVAAAAAAAVDSSAAVCLVLEVQ